MKNFWDKKHINNDIGSLSGHPAAAVIDGLYINDIIKPKMEVLEIGVGLGICTRDLKNMNMSVSVVDISSCALNRVKDIVLNSCLDTQIHMLPTDFFDIAISYCVVQHMNNEGLAQQLKNVIRSLKPSGIYVMQYAIPFHDVNYNESDLAMQAGAVCRPLEMMYDMVSAAGGKIIYHRIRGMFPQYKSGWAIAHIGKI